MTNKETTTEQPKVEHLHTVTRMWKNKEQICKSPLMPAHLAISWVLRSERERGKYEYEGGCYEYWLEDEFGAVFPH